eukprot:CAMPEP_0194130252 /NCGR_PEP_ID=MMETSP0152-20130528/1326_1 /TAXON_ID=1049557 /ORGANISM="Thalassiothrix antarctica, Strain L6-D1" /LENGTH=226 /DNA_ID=CAMNT_0038824697 /DNA_START=54 /DNA_END=734 /DNA_ORIENTATION=+
MKTFHLDADFESMFEPNEMRLLALVSHNNMKESMKEFVIANKNLLKKFRLTGTQSTMMMLKDIFKDEPDITYGPICASGPLGGDAQLVAMTVMGQLGGCIFFIDPMDSHPHNVDIECLCRQCNVHNILMTSNPTTATILLTALRFALQSGKMELMPSFFFNLESPSVAAYKKKQQAVITQYSEENGSKYKNGNVSRKKQATKLTRFGKEKMNPKLKKRDPSLEILC